MEQSTGCNDPEVLEKLYNHYLQPSAWKLTPGALDALAQIKLPGNLHLHPTSGDCNNIHYCELIFARPVEWRSSETYFDEVLWKAD